LALEALEGRALLSTWMVNSLGDASASSGPYSGDLRYVLTQVDKTTGDNTIKFLVTGKITLHSALPELGNTTGLIDIEGPGAAKLTVARSTGPGTPDFRIFTIDAGVNAKLDGLTITAGRADNGGGIHNVGILALEGCTVAGDSETSFDYHAGGGGIYNVGTLTISDSTISGNSAVASGGGITNVGTLTISDSTIGGNSAVASGGGITNVGTVTITASTIIGNSADYGGGISNHGTMVVNNSTIASNSGGGMLNSGTMAVNNSTIASNSGHQWIAGGIDNHGGALAITNSTIAFNSGGGISSGVTSYWSTLKVTNSTIASNSGGGIGIWDGSMATLENTIVALNTQNADSSATPDDIFLGGGTVSSSGAFNLIGTGGSGGLIDGDNGNQVGVANPGLGPLADNGGPTWTMALLPWSPARDAGDNSWAIDPITGLPLLTDQRGSGFPRIVGDTVDIGAFEYQVPPPIPPVADAGGPYVIHEGDSLTLDSLSDGYSLTYSWDVNGDGVFTDATGAHPTLSWNRLTELGITDGPANFNVKVRVADRFGNMATSPAVDLRVINVPPAATFSDNGPVVVGEPVTVQFTNPTDPSPIDTAAGFHYAFATDPAALAGATYENSSSVPYASFTFSTTGEETVYGRIIARDHDYSQYSTQFIVSLPGFIPVLNNHDSGPGSLRQAIALVSAGDRILFNNSLKGQTITLTTGELVIDKSLDIEGLGAASLTVSGGGATRVFDIENSSASVTIAGLTITGGRADNGGAIYNAGTLTINACTISGNSTGWKGGAIVNSGTMTFTNSSITGNSTYDGDGGGIINSGTMTFTNSSVTGNVAGTDSGWWGHGGGDGGGVYNSGTMTLTNSSVNDNISNRGYSSDFHYSVWAGDGGGIYNGSGTITLTNSTVAGNSYGDRGGGIYNDSGKVSLINSTVAANQPSSEWYGVGGGGIYNGSGTVILTNSTVAANQSIAEWQGGGGGIRNDSGTVSLAASIVAGNSAPAGQAQDGMGAFGSLGHNLIGNQDGSSGWIATDLLDVHPMLGPLQDNGGPTMTMAPLTGSPAIDAGGTDLPVDPITREPLAIDQRGDGFSRMANGKLDIGAVEVQSYIAMVSVRWGSQAAFVQTAGDGLRLLPNGRQTDLPWLDIQQLQINLTQPAALIANDISVVGASGNYGVSLSGSGTSYTIILSRPIYTADRVTITIGNDLIASFTRRLDILPGDVNDDGVVNAQDMVLIRNAIQKTGDPLMIGWADVDGLGGLNVNDYLAARKKLGSRLR
jgi:hypothetical protein